MGSQRSGLQDCVRELSVPDEAARGRGRVLARAARKNSCEVEKGNRKLEILIYEGKKMVAL
jgi:hypothetical protein